MLISIFEFVAANKDNGYGVALCNPAGRCVAPYVDPSDYPEVMVREGLGDVQRTIHNEPRLAGYFLSGHGGILETQPNFLLRA